MYSLEQVCGGSSILPTQDKTENMIMNLIMPLCLRVGSGRKGFNVIMQNKKYIRYDYLLDVAMMKQSDISFALILVLHAVSPPSTKTATTTGQNIKGASEMRAGSLTFTGTRDTKATARINTSLYKVSFLGKIQILLKLFLIEISVLALKIMAICFEGELVRDWLKISRTMRELGKRNEATTYLWDFLEFVVTHRTPLFILMQPLIFQKVKKC